MTAFVHLAARDGSCPLLFLCDHASPALPAAYGSLGLDPALLASHIAYDIGAATVTRALAGYFGVAAILGAWSRLLIDLNRGTDDPTLVMMLSDGSIIPGNRDIGPDEVAMRIREFHVPYHEAVAAEIARLRAVSPPTLVSIHSFTPVWKGTRRPWDVGVLWDRDGRLAHPLMARLREVGLVVGDNEPYSGALENDCLNRHGTRMGFAHALIEIRQDLVGTEKMAAAFATVFAPILKAALADMNST